MKARKRFGQHFLEKAWVDKLIGLIAAKPDEWFLEIGPGQGALTLPLAADSWVTLTGTGPPSTV